MKIARKAGIRVLKESVVNVLGDNEFGRSFYNGTVWTVVYRDDMSMENCRFTIAHELGHILLGHSLANARYVGNDTRILNKISSAEKQANMFAERLLCPSCVIWMLGLDSAEEIAEFCHVDITVAERRWKRKKLLDKRGKYLTDPLEAEVYKMYQPYVQSVLAEKKNEIPTK